MSGSERDLLPENILQYEAAAAVRHPAVDLDEETRRNSAWRRVRLTTRHQQVVIMSVPDRIPMEVHADNDQFIKIVEGRAVVQVGEHRWILAGGQSVTVPAGAKHEVLNTGPTHLKMYTVYSPPHHPPNLVEMLPPGRRGCC